MNDQFDLGPIRVRVSGDHPVASRVRDELGANPASGEPDLEVEITSVDPPPHGSSPLSGSRLFLKQRVWAFDGSLSGELSMKLGTRLYRVDLSAHPMAEAPVKAEITLGFSSRMADLVSRPLIRLGTRDFSSLRDLLAKNVVYEIIDPLVWCKLLAKGSTIAHAAAAQSPSGKGVAFLGTGGVGKSTLVLSLVKTRGWSYLADDYAIIGPSVGIARYPKRLQIYAYNSQLVPDLERRLLAGRPRLDRMLWTVRRRLLGAKQVRRRVKDVEIFGPDFVSDRAPLDFALFLSPAPRSDKPEIAEADKSRYARRSATILVNEMWNFTHMLNAFGALDPSLPSIADLHALTAEITEKAIPDDGCFEVRVPAGLPGPALAEFVEQAVR